MRTLAQVIVSLGPMRIDVARLQRGQIAVRSSAWLDRSTLEQAWECELTTLDTTLAQLLRAVGARPGDTAVIEYSHLDTTVDVFSLPPDEDAINGALKQLSEASDIDLANNPSAVMYLGSTTDGQITQQQVLCSTDLDERVDVLRQWALKAELRPVAYVPIEAASVAAAVQTALDKHDGLPRVVVQLGEQRTAIVLVNQNELKLVRCVNMGLAALVDAAAEAQNAAGQIVEAAQRRAGYDMLRRSGVGMPVNGRMSRAEVTDRLLPYVNPALQRYVVEIRQSLRFGLPPQDAARAILVACGPGSAISGLDQTLANQLEIVAEPSGQEFPDSSAAVDLGISLRTDTARLNLVPQSHRRAVQTRRAVFGVVVGGVAAFAIAAGDAALVWEKAHRFDERTASLAPRMADLTQRAEQFTTLSLVRNENADMYHAIRSAVGSQPDWKLVFNDLANATFSDMRLSELSVGAGPSGASISLRGMMPVDRKDSETQPATDSTSPIAAFLDALGKSSTVEAAELGETRTAEVQGISVELFAADVKLKGVPFMLAGSQGN